MWFLFIGSWIYDPYILYRQPPFWELRCNNGFVTTISSPKWVFWLQPFLGVADSIVKQNGGCPFKKLKGCLKLTHSLTTQFLGGCRLILTQPCLLQTINPQQNPHPTATHTTNTTTHPSTNKNPPHSYTSPVPMLLATQNQPRSPPKPKNPPQKYSKPLQTPSKNPLIAQNEPLSPQVPFHWPSFSFFDLWI